MSSQGWIKLHRQILECSLWCGFDDEPEEPFDKRSAWIDLLLRANHNDKEIVFNYKPLTVGRGQLLTSVRKLSSRWGWSVTKTYNYLNLLTELGMITKESDYNKTLLTIVNYDIYQDLGNTQETQSGTVEKHSRNTQETLNGHKQEYKELKNEKNVKNNKDKAIALLETLLPEKNISEPLADKLHEWIIYKCERKEGYQETGMKSLLSQMEKKEQQYGSTALIECIETCMSRQYKGIIDDLIKTTKQTTNDYLERWANA